MSPELQHSTDQRLGALEQDMAASRKAIATLENESAIARERIHHDSGIVQRLVMQAEEFTKAFTRIEISIATMATSFLSQGETTEKQGKALDKHVEECGRLTTAADVNRRSFRKEMRGYFVAIIAFVLGWFLTHELHLPGAL